MSGVKQSKSSRQVLRMSDLISRRELIKHFEAIQQEENVVGLEFVATIDEIKEQPIAYDIDKVVKELKERTDFLKGCTKYGNKDAKQQTESYSTMMMYEVADLVDDLIEIVKQGSDANGVCEWKKYPFDWFTGCDGYKINHKQGDYCPRCGKKIKIKAVE